MDNIELIGYIATCFGAIQLLPEILKALRTHHLRDVAWGMLALMIISSILWIVYGFSKMIIPLAISAGLNMLFELFLVGLKIHYSSAKNPLLQPATEREPVLSESPDEQD